MKTAMVVDGEARLRRQVAETLQQYGFEEVLEVEDGRQAVALAISRRPLLIVMDMAMSGMDGVTAAEKISRAAPTPIVLLTAGWSRETLERARAAGATGCLVKPFSDARAMPVIELAIEHFSQTSNLRAEVARLREALETRKLIDRAKSILIRNGLQEQDAHRKIQKIAMDKRTTLKQVAEAILLMEC